MHHFKIDIRKILGRKKSKHNLGGNFTIYIPPFGTRKELENINNNKTFLFNRSIWYIVVLYYYVAAISVNQGATLCEY